MDFGVNPVVHGMCKYCVNEGGPRLVDLPRRHDHPRQGMPVRGQEVLVELRLSGLQRAVVSDVELVERLGDAHRRPDVDVYARVFLDLF